MSAQLQVTGEAKIRDLQGPVVANSGVITALDGLPSQYVRGDGTLADIPSVTGGGSSVSYYLNGSVNQGTFGGSTYYELGENAITGIGTNFSTSTNGLLAQFITDAGVPDVTEIPSGNWNIEFYMGVSASSGALASFYVDIFKYDGTTFTLIASNSATPDFLTNTTIIDAYFTSVAMPLTSMAETDRIAIRVYASVAGKTVTIYTEDNRLCQVVTTFSRGMLSLNSLTDQQQYLTVGTAGTDFNIASSVDTHTFNIPSASSSNRGLITTGTQSIAGVKTFLSSTIQEGLSVLKNDAFQVIPSGYTALTGYGLGGLTILQGDGTNVYNTDLDFPNTSNRQYTFPDITGTVALLQGTQTFSGEKTFSNTIEFNDYVLMDIGVALAKTSGTPLYGGTNGYANLQLVNAASVNSLYLIDGDTGKYSKLSFNNAADYTYTFPDLSGTLALLEGSQVFIGSKTFNAFTSFNGNTTRLSKGIYFDKGGLPSALSNATNNLYSDLGSNNLVIEDLDNKSKLQFQSTGNLTYTFPALTGTIALLEGSQTFTGAKTFSASVVNDDGLKIKFGSASNLTANYLTLSAYGLTSPNRTVLRLGTTATTLSELYFSQLSSYQYTFPDASGTLALTSNLSAYLPLIGGTLTGDLSIDKSSAILFLKSATGGANSIGFLVNGVSVGGITVTSTFYQFNNNTSYGYLFKNAAGNNLLSIQDSGAAVFLGSVSATIGDFSSWVKSTGYRLDGMTGGSGALYYNSAANRVTVANYNASGILTFEVNGGATALTLASTGAATFSSSVTAGSFIKSNTLFSCGTGSGKFLGVGSDISGGYLSTDFVLYNTGGDLRLYSTGGVGMIVKETSGNVGIGTSSNINQKFTVDSSYTRIESRASDNTNAGTFFKVLNGATTVGQSTQAVLNNGDYIITTGTSSETERMRITSGGNVTIGSTSALGRLNSFSQTASVPAMWCSSNFSGDVGYTAMRIDKFDNNSSTSQIFINFSVGNNSVANGQINGNGSGAVAFGSWSDKRLKENIVDLEPQLNNILSLRPVEFDYIESEGGGHQTGFIAQEMQEVYPDSVGERLDGMLTISGWSKTEARLVKAIQEFKAEKDAEIAELRNQIEELKALIAAK